MMKPFTLSLSKGSDLQRTQASEAFRQAQRERTRLSGCLPHHRLDSERVGWGHPKLLTRILAALLFLCGISIAHADIFRPAYLELRERDASTYDVLWKVPALGDSQRLAAYVRFPEGTNELGARRSFFVDGAHVERWRVQSNDGLVGKTIRIDGLNGVTDVLARVERLDGTAQVVRLPPEGSHFVVEPPAGVCDVARTYIVLGVEHILGGIDHLMFVLALLLIVRGGKRIVATVTAFTVAHSITLVAATLGWVNIPGPPVEAIIALSIVFVASEVVQGLNGRPGLTARAPWVVAFSFGLLHGLGFAGALAEVGLPQTAIPMALLAFNLGVEVGQLLFVAVVLALIAALRRVCIAVPRSMEFIPPYAIGTVAMFWVFERIAAF